MKSSSTGKANLCGFQSWGEGLIYYLFLSAGDLRARCVFHPDGAVRAEHVHIFRIDQVRMMCSDKTKGLQFLIISLQYFRDQYWWVIGEVHIGIIAFCFHAGDLAWLHDQ